MTNGGYRGNPAGKCVCRTDKAELAVGLLVSRLLELSPSLLHKHTETPDRLLSSRVSACVCVHVHTQDCASPEAVSEWRWAASERILSPARDCI